MENALTTLKQSLRRSMDNRRLSGGHNGNVYPRQENYLIREHYHSWRRIISSNLGKNDLRCAKPTWSGPSGPCSQHSRQANASIHVRNSLPSEEQRLDDESPIDIHFCMDSSEKAAPILKACLAQNSLTSLGFISPSVKACTSSFQACAV